MSLSYIRTAPNCSERGLHRSGNLPKTLDLCGDRWYNVLMENVKQIVSQNLIKLRKENGLTQAELAKLINYSDKAISRWETGEVVPDLETIYALSEVFEVPVSAITEKQSDEKKTDDKAQSLSQKILSQIFLACEIWFIICAIYVYFKISRQSNIWQIFVWGVPATALMLWFFNRKEPLNVLLFIYATIFVWSFITCVYLHLLDSNPWYLYFIGLPLQGLLIVRYVFNYKQSLAPKIRIRGKKREKEEI